MAHPKVFDLAEQAEQAIRDFRHAARTGDKQMAGAQKRRAVSLLEWADIFLTHPQAAESSYETARQRMEAEND